MLHVGQNLAPRGAVTPAAVGDKAPWLKPEPGQLPPEEASGHGRVAPVLHQDVEHDAVLTVSPPEVVQHAVNPQEHLIKVPGVALSLLVRRLEHRHFP